MTRTRLLTGLLTMALSAGTAATLAAQAPAAAAAPPPPTVQVGQPMPDFSLPYLEPAPDGGRPQQKTVKLSDFAGKRVVVLAFFPAAFSPG